MSRWFKRLAVPVLAVLMVGMFISSAQAVRSIEPTGETPGDVVIYPYYDVSYATSLNYFYLVNTTKFYVQAHIRFRTAECSIEVLDFDVILTPYDVFTFWVLPQVTDADGITGPGFYSADAHTLAVSGLIPAKYFDSNGYVTIAFNTRRLLDLHIAADDAADMLPKGYVEVIAEGLIQSDFWSNCGPFKSLVAAATTDIKESCTWDTNNSKGDFSNVDSIFGNHGVDHVGKTTNGTNVRIDNGELLYGTEYFVDFASASGYGVNAATITAFRTSSNGTHVTLDKDYIKAQHIDDNYAAPGWPANLVSGYNGLILHADYVGSDMINKNPFFRPDWATTFGPTLAFGDDMDAWSVGYQLVYGSVDDLEENWYANMMNENSRYTAPYFSTNHADSLITYLMLNFFTKHYHYFTKLLYDPERPPYYTHGTSSSALDRLVDNVYNFNLPAVAPCGGSFWNVKFKWTARDTDEHTVPGTASPGKLLSITHEAMFEAVGPGADLLNTGTFQEGYYLVGDFELDHDDARAETSGGGGRFLPINCGNTTACNSTAWNKGYYQYTNATEIYDVEANTADTLNFVPAIGFDVIRVSGVGDYEYDLTIYNSPWATVAFNPANNLTNARQEGNGTAPAAP